jgi:hypothetical protein
MENTDLMNTAEVSEFLKIRIDTLHKKVSRRQIPFTRMPHSNRIYFSKKQVSEWLFSNSQIPAIK